MPSVCYRYSHWNVGVIQGSQDIIMSRFFGNIFLLTMKGWFFLKMDFIKQLRNLKIVLLDFQKCVSRLPHFSPFRWKKIDGVGPYKFSKRVYRGGLKKFRFKVFKKRI